MERRTSLETVDGNPRRAKRWIQPACAEVEDALSEAVNALESYIVELEP